MKIKTNSWHAKFYKHAYNINPSYDNVPNLCMYFSRIVWALLTYPLYCFGFLMIWICSTKEERGCLIVSMWDGFLLQHLVIVLVFFSTMSGYGILINKTSLEFSGFLLFIVSFLIGAITFTSVIISVGVVTAILIYISSLFKRSEDDGLFMSAFKSWRDKHCPIIEWVDDEDKKNIDNS